MKIKKKSTINVEEVEIYYLKLIEEKQLELIWHPDRREQCGIQFLAGDSSRIVYSYSENTPMSFFRELNMFYLFLSDLQVEDWTYDSWKPYAIKAVSYLRMLPVEIQAQHLEAYHYAVSCLYKEMGNDHKARLHHEQALAYSTDSGCSFDVGNILNVLDEFKDNPKVQLDICMYILGFITADDVWMGLEYYDFWQREQYELVENILKHDILQYVDDEDERPLFELIIFCLRGIYYKRTRRFLLAEKYFMKAIELSSTLPYENFFITPLMVYTLLGQMYVGMNDMEKADACFKKALDMDSWDADILKPLVLVYYDTAMMTEEDWNKLDDDYVRTFSEICQEDISFSSFVKKAIDDFFAPSDLYDGEQDDEDNDMEQNEQKYTFDDWYELAENGDVKAQLIVGYCYFTGTTVAQNYRIAREWFYLAALQGDAISQQNLSFMYEQGYGTDINKDEAKKWCWKANHEATWRQELIDYQLK